MTSSVPLSTKFARRLASPSVIVTLFVLTMSACVIGLVAWKTTDARTTALEHNEVDIRNLTHSLSEHATHTIQAVDVAISDIVAFLGQYSPTPDRFNRHLSEVAASLPQIEDIVVHDATGETIFTSRRNARQHNNADRDYFAFHRDNPDRDLLVSGPVVSRTSGLQSIVLTKRVQDLSGKFIGVVAATIPSSYFTSFYKSIELGDHSSIALMRTDGHGLIRWPETHVISNPSKMPLFRDKLPNSPTGYYRTRSYFDDLIKYFGYERLPNYPLVVTVAQPEENVLAGWRSHLRTDLAVAATSLCSVILLALLLSAQLRLRARVETTLREREEQYRLLADNIADVVLVLDRDKICRYVSQSATTILRWDPKQIVGTSCFDHIYPDDIVAVKLAYSRLTDTTDARTIVFRMIRGDLSLAWVEANFKRAPLSHGDDSATDIVAVLRDVTRRREMEDQLNALNSRLAELATTDSLTGLANRRTLDVFLRREFAATNQLAVLLLDIDHFKGFNDTQGHQAGDQCLRRVAEVLAEATANSRGLSARYGGEEFALILPGLSEEAALDLAETVRLKVQSLGLANTASEHGCVTVSIGVAAKLPGTSSEVALLGEADQALYEAKRSGRNRCIPGSSLHDAASLAPTDCCDLVH